MINQDDEARGDPSRWRLARGGRLDTFVALLGAAPDLDEHTRSWARELASEAAFLFVVEDDVARCRTLH